MSDIKLIQCGVLLLLGMETNLAVEATASAATRASEDAAAAAAAEDEPWLAATNSLGCRI